MYRVDHLTRSAVNCNSVGCSDSRTPYGVYLTSAGELILFDRRYRPMFRRDAAGLVHRDDPCRWIEDIVGKAWFYDGATSPRCNRETLKRIALILERWRSADGSCRPAAPHWLCGRDYH